MSKSKEVVEWMCEDSTPAKMTRAKFELLTRYVLSFGITPKQIAETTDFTEHSFKALYQGKRTFHNLKKAINQFLDRYEMLLAEQNISLCQQLKIVMKSPDKFEKKLAEIESTALTAPTVVTEPATPKGRRVASSWRGGPISEPMRIVTISIPATNAAPLPELPPL